MLVTVSRESANAGVPASSAYVAPAALLMAARDSLGEVAVLAFGLGGLMYYWVFYRSRLVPRWLSAWGLVAITSVMASGLLVMLGLAAPMSVTQLVLALPIAVQEMVLAVWLITRGFNPRAAARPRRPTAERWGMRRLRTVGRHTDEERIAILGHIEDGSNLVTKAMNGWADPEPAWWLNLLARGRCCEEHGASRR